jgi:hypothetical protein
MWQVVQFLKFDSEILKYSEFSEYLNTEIRKAMAMKSEHFSVLICLYSNLEPIDLLESHSAAEIEFEKYYSLILSQDLGLIGNRGFSEATIKKTELKIAHKFLKISDWGRTKSLGFLFNEVKACFTDDAKVLFYFWDHGSAFGIFHGTENTNNKKSLLKAGREINFVHPMLSNFTFFSGGMQKPHMSNYLIAKSNDDIVFFKEEISNIDSLSMDELAQALTENSFKPNILVLANCFMYCIDTVYALRDSTNHLIASPTAISLTMFKWDQILKEMKNQSYSCKDVCKLFINCAANTDEIWMHQSIRIVEREFKNRIALFCLEMKTMKETALWEQLRLYFEILTLKFKDKDFLQTLKSNKFSFPYSMNMLILNPQGVYHFRDAFTIFRRINAICDLSEKEQQASNDLIETMITLRKKNIHHIGSLLKGGQYNTLGFTLLFPKKREQFNIPHIRYYYNNSNNLGINSFAKVFDWDLILLNYYKSF